MGLVDSILQPQRAAGTGGDVRKVMAVVWAFMGLVGAAGPAAAQSIGLTGGATLASVTFDDGFARDTAFAPGATGGVTVGIGLVGRLGISAEALFTLDRTRLEGGPEDRFQYLDVPVQLRYRLRNTADGPVTLAVGAMYRRLIKATETSVGETYEITDGVHADDMAIVASVEVPVGPGWSVTGRYVQGQNEIFRRITGAYSGRWRTVQVLARYAFWH
jgi:hypothetical protein